MSWEDLNKMPLIQIHVSPQTNEILMDLARKKAISKADVIIQILERELK
jgi:hypothetical protein